MRPVPPILLFGLLLATPLQAQLQPRLPQAPDPQPALPKKPLALVNGVPYQRPTPRQTFTDYLRDSYGLPALLRVSVRSLYAQGRDRPVEWGQDWGGFGQRFGSSAATNIITGNVRYAMELTFHEDLRYLPCLHCTAKAKLENALLAEITARHDDDGHRFFTLTPTIADFSGPIIAHAGWYPPSSNGPLQGVVSARTVFATRIGAHIFREFVLERYHRSTPEPTRQP